MDTLGCSWKGDAGMEALLVGLGLPCFSVMGYCVVSGACGLRCLAPHVADIRADRGSAGMKSAYGMLIDVSDVSADVESVIDRWIQRCACAAVFESVTLMAFSLTSVVHAHIGKGPSFGVYSFEAFLQFLSRLTAGISAHHVHRRLSRVSRNVAGSWVLVCAIALYIMAMSGMMYMALYIHAAVVGQMDLCNIYLCSYWSMMLSCVFQSCAAFALFRIHERAAIFAQDQRVFSRVVGNHWSVLVSSMFGVGFSFFLAAVVIIFPSRLDQRHEPVGILVLLAAFCQSIVGLSMLSINRGVKTYFQSPEGKATLARAIEMAHGIEGDIIGADADLS